MASSWPEDVSSLTVPNVGCFPGLFWGWLGGGGAGGRLLFLLFCVFPLYFPHLEQCGTVPGMGCE